MRAHPSADPMSKGFDYAKEFESLDLDAGITDLHALMTDSQEWWPCRFRSLRADCSSAWPGTQRRHLPHHRRLVAAPAGLASRRFALLNSWPDNANLDKVAPLLWPIKQKYGSKLSWADLFVLVGNVALESMGFKTFDSLVAGPRYGVGAWRRPWPRVPEGTWLGDLNATAASSPALRAARRGCRWA